MDVPERSEARVIDVDHMPTLFGHILSHLPHWRYIYELLDTDVMFNTRRMVNPNPLPRASFSHPNLLSGAGQDAIDERNDIIDPLVLV